MRARATSRWAAPTAPTERIGSSSSSRTHRGLEAFALVAVAILSADLVWGLARAPMAIGSVLAVISATGLGWIGADFVSGLVHWFADRIASERLCWIGPNFIRPFREHHDDPRAITRHGFLETNGNTCIVAMPVLLVVAATVDPGAGGPGSAFAVAFALVLGVSVCATNQIHKWAHAMSPPRAVRALQRAHLVLCPDHHARHHRAPFATHFCITTGWLNPALDRSRLFPALERVVRRTSASRRDPVADDGRAVARSSRSRTRESAFPSEGGVGR